MTHNHLWVGVDLKIQAARTTLDEMRKALQPAVPTAWSVVQESTGTIVGGPDWQSIFYPLVPRFLSDVRSVPWIIEACFGFDRSPPMKTWWNQLPLDEQKRRKTFSDQFRADRKAIDDHALTTERNVADH